MTLKDEVVKKIVMNVIKSVEKYLMLTLCKLYKLEEKYYNAEH